MTQRYATTDADGRATGFYADALNPTIPPEAFPIEEETWASWVSNTSTQRWDGTGLVTCDPPAVAEVPPMGRVLSPLQFMDRFTDDEEGRIVVAAAQAAANGQPRLQRWLSRLTAAQEVHLDHPDLQLGLDALVDAGLLTRERVAVILTP